MTLKETQELIEAWNIKNGVRHNELTNMALLTEEMGQLARVVAHRYGEHTSDPKFQAEMSREIGDIFWALTNLANQTGVDLMGALIEALERNSQKIKTK